MKKIAATLGAAVAVAGAVTTAHAVSAQPDVALTASEDVLSGTANGWAYSYDMGDAELVLSPARAQLAWQIPATFTRGDQTITGDDFWRPSDGQSNSVFIANGDSDAYPGGYFATDHDPLPFPQSTPSIFFSPNGYDNLDGSNAMLGSWELGPGLSLITRPADYTDPVTFAAALDKTVPEFSQLLNIATGNSASDTWEVSGVSEHDVTGYASLPMWSGTVTFDDPSAAPGQQAITGTEYMWTPWLNTYAQEFVATVGGHTETLADTPGPFGLDNLYYSPGDGGPAVDVLKTPFGDMDLSAIAGLFTPPDYADAPGASPDSAPFNGGDLTAAFDFADSLSPTASDTGASAADALSGLG